MCDVLLQYDLEQMKVKIQKDYGKTYKELLEYVEIMKDWLKTQEHLPQITRDEIIRSYILMCKFSIERVKSKLDFYYSIRSKFPEYYKNTIPSKNPDIFELMDQVYFLLLPKLTTTLNRVLFLKITEQCIPETFDIERYVVVAFNNFEIMITEDIAYTYDVIFDLQHFNSALFAKLTPIFIKKILYLMQKVYSTRPYTLTTINMNPTLEYLCKKVIVPLLPAKLASRVFFSKNADEFLNRFPNDVIPKDYGGNGISLKDLNEKWKQKLLQYDSRFEQLENAKVNEDKRPEKLVNDEVLGFYGNFKKLDVD